MQLYQDALFLFLQYCDCFSHLQDNAVELAFHAGFSKYMLGCAIYAIAVHSAVLNAFV